jgi:hypothetical protein
MTMMLTAIHGKNAVEAAPSNEEIADYIAHSEPSD